MSTLKLIVVLACVEPATPSSNATANGTRLDGCIRFILSDGFRLILTLFVANFPRNPGAFCRTIWRWRTHLLYHRQSCLLSHELWGMKAKRDALSRRHHAW